MYLTDADWETQWNHQSHSIVRWIGIAHTFILIYKCAPSVAKKIHLIEINMYPSDVPVQEVWLNGWNPLVSDPSEGLLLAGNSMVEVMNMAIPERCQTLLMGILRGFWFSDCFYPSYPVKLLFFTFLFICKRDKVRDIWHPLVHSPSIYNTQCWVELRQDLETQFRFWLCVSVTRMPEPSLVYPRSVN